MPQTLSPQERQQGAQALSAPLPPPLPLLDRSRTHTTHIARYARVLAQAHIKRCVLARSHRDEIAQRVAQALVIVI